MTRNDLRGTKFFISGRMSPLSLMVVSKTNRFDFGLITKSLRNTNILAPYHNHYQILWSIDSGPNLPENTCLGCISRICPFLGIQPVSKSSPLIFPVQTLIKTILIFYPICNDLNSRSRNLERFHFTRSTGQFALEQPFNV